MLIWMGSAIDLSFWELFLFDGIFGVGDFVTRIARMSASRPSSAGGGSERCWRWQAPSGGAGKVI